MDEDIKRKILSLLDQHRIMTIATNRPYRWPQATTVGYVNEGLTLYFLCGLDSQKAANLARDNRVSLTIDHDADQIMQITGLSMAAHAQPVVDRDEAEKVLRSRVRASLRNWHFGPSIMGFEDEAEQSQRRAVELALSRRRNEGIEEPSNGSPRRPPRGPNLARSQ